MKKSKLLDYEEIMAINKSEILLLFIISWKSHGIRAPSLLNSKMSNIYDIYTFAGQNRPSMASYRSI